MNKAIQNFLHILAPFFSSASEFKREWKHCGNQSHNGSFEGCWNGKWISEENGHSGNLKCVLHDLDSRRVSALFHATYSKILKVSYKVTLDREVSGETLKLHGRANLGTLAGGWYEYDGRISGGHFECSYSCKYDHGRFEMKKVTWPLGRLQTFH